MLRQGLQRQVRLDLHHSSGRSWPWASIKNVRIGSVRLLDLKGLVHAAPSHEAVEVRGKRQDDPSYGPGGTSLLSFSGSWDSGAHDCIFLNRITSDSTRILLRLQWQVMTPLHEPADFSMDISVSVQERDVRGPSRLLTMFSSGGSSRRCTNALFAVRIRPGIVRTSADVWRYDTSEEYVRGEELLGGWKARTQSLVDDFKARQQHAQSLAELEITKGVLSLHDGRWKPSTDSQAVSDTTLMLERVVRLWRTGLGQTPVRSCCAGCVCADRCSEPSREVSLHSEQHQL